MYIYTGDVKVCLGLLRREQLRINVCDKLMRRRTTALAVRRSLATNRYIILEDASANSEEFSQNNDRISRVSSDFFIGSRIRYAAYAWPKMAKHRKKERKKERKSIYIALFGQGGTLKALRHGSHSFTCK